MHVKLTTSGGRRYVQLVESYRDEAGRVKKRTVATLGRAEQVDGSLDAVINGLLKITGREPMGAKPPAPTVSFESARSLGNVWALTELWKSLGFSGLRRVFRRTRRTTDVEALIRLMVLNRLCDPESKLGVLRWVQTVALPDFGPKAVTHQQLLRSLDALMDHQDEVDAVVAGLLRPLIDQDLSVVFYDLTTIRSEGLSQQVRDVRLLRQFVPRLNLEMSVAEEIVTIACEVVPQEATLVPEKREELTTEGGLDVCANTAAVEAAVKRLHALGIEVSLFIDPDPVQIDVSRALGVRAVEIQTARYSKATAHDDIERELADLKAAASHAVSKGLIVHMGHGLNYRNVCPVVRIPGVQELNIGHSIVSRAVMVGLERAVREMKEAMRL